MKDCTKFLTKETCGNYQQKVKTSDGKIHHYKGCDMTPQVDKDGYYRYG